MSKKPDLDVTPTVSGAMTVNAQYIKDLSFESPHAPYSFMASESPAIDIALEINVKSLEKDNYEVVLKVEINAKSAAEHLFIIELQYAGVFSLEMANLTDEQKELILSVNCPSMLFPYARRIISDVTRDGGYPPLMISPVDFLGLYMQRKGQDDKPEDHVIN